MLKLVLKNIFNYFENYFENSKITTYESFYIVRIMITIVFKIF